MSLIGRVELAVTTSLNCNFLRRPRPADLVGHGQILKLGKRLAVGEVLLYSEGEPEPVGDDADIAEGHRAFVELAVRHPGFDDIVDQLVEFLRGRPVDAPGGAFDGVGEFGAAVIARISWTLDGLVGEDGPLRLEHARARVVLGRNQLDVLFLAGALVV